VALAAQVAHVRLVPAAQVVLVVLVVRLVPVALRVLASEVPVHVLALVALAQVPVQVVASAHLVLVAVLRPVAVVAVAALLVHSVRVALVAHRRPASRSVQSAKSLSRDQHLALVAQLFHAAMAPPFCACAAVQACRTSQTRLMQTLVS
jgi:hypothetical protein